MKKWWIVPAALLMIGAQVLVIKGLSQRALVATAAVQAGQPELMFLNMTSAGRAAEPTDILTLVNATHLSDGAVADLVSLSDDAGSMRLKNNSLQGCAEAVRALSRMARAIEDNGCGTILVVSAYRSLDYQSRLFENKVERVMAQGYGSRSEAEEAAATEVARPGQSEHHTGLAFDLAGPDGQLETFENTEACAWMDEHAAEYGFIKRYPPDKCEKTGIIHEPWHYRYVGEEAARAIKSQGLCLEEYLEQRAQ